MYFQCGLKKMNYYQMPAKVIAVMADLVVPVPIKIDSVPRTIDRQLVINPMRSILSFINVGDS